MAKLPTEALDWLAALRHPTRGDLKLTPYIRAPEHIPVILKAFGPRSSCEVRRILLAVDDLAVKYIAAKKHRPLKFAAADDLFASLEASMTKTLRLWEKAGPLHPVLLRALVHITPPKERKTQLFNWRDMDPHSALKKALDAVRAARNPNVYRLATDQAPPKDAQKLPERALLWEPVLHLMEQFGVRDYSEHQPLMRTMRALHFVLGIAPPDANAFKQAIRAWKKARG